MNKICVFCGSSPGRDIAYIEAAVLLGKELARRKIDLIYGGANVGLMGQLADTVLAQGGRVTGVMPEKLVEKEVAHPGLSRLRVVSSMHERKALMAELADGFIALPGGFGTLDETFEIVTWAQLGFHKKPCGLLNISGFYDELLGFLKTAAKQRFLKEAHLRMLMVSSEPKILLDRFESYQAPVVDKWITVA